MEGLKIASLYSLGCPELRQIGAENFILNFLKNPERSKTLFVKDILKKLEPFVYYRLLAKKNGISNPFNKNVVKAHWLGNNLLKPLEEKDLNDISSVYFLKLSDLIGAKPHHNFSVFWSAKRTDKIPIEKIDECLIKSGKVIEIKEKTILVETVKLCLNKKEIFLQETKEEISKGFLRGFVGFDDLVSIHFQQAREKISRNCAQNLIEITKEAINFFKE